MLLYDPSYWHWKRVSERDRENGEKLTALRTFHSNTVQLRPVFPQTHTYNLYTTQFAHILRQLLRVACNSNVWNWLHFSDVGRSRNERARRFNSTEQTIHNNKFVYSNCTSSNVFELWCVVYAILA